MSWPPWEWKLLAQRPPTAGARRVRATADPNAV